MGVFISFCLGKIIMIEMESTGTRGIPEQSFLWFRMGGKCWQYIIVQDISLLEKYLYSFNKKIRFTVDTLLFEIAQCKFMDWWVR